MHFNLNWSIIKFKVFTLFKAEDNMKKYGKSLVNAVPDEATQLLKVLCTDYRPQLLNERELQYSL